MNDAAFIEHLGGPAKVCELLHYDKRAGGVQRVQNWRTRGIPPRVKMDHPEIFAAQAAAAAESRRAAAETQGA